MKDLSPARVSIVCFLFLVILYFTSAFDLALGVSAVAVVYLYNLVSVWLILASIIFFALYVVLNFLSLKVPYIADLSISSYLLFAGGLISYFLQGSKNRWTLKLPFKGEIEITGQILVKIGGILLLTILIYPLTGVHLAAGVGYIVFQFIFRKNDGRHAFSIALLFLILCPILLIAKKDKVAETSAIFTYYFLVIGTIQEIIRMVKNPQEYSEEENKGEMANIPRTYLLHSEKLKRRHSLSAAGRTTDFPEIVVKRQTKLIFMASIGAILLVSGILYNHFTESKQSKPKSAAIIPSVSPTMIPTPIVLSQEQIASLAATLKVYVGNGTEISGLAASTSAVLKKLGFRDIKIGNVEKRDYKSWEVSLKKEEPQLVGFLKKSLSLTSLTVNTATPGAKFDMMIIIGETK